MKIGDIVIIMGSEYKVIEIKTDEYGNQIAIYEPVN